MDHVIGEPTVPLRLTPYDPLPSEGTHNGYVKGGARSFVPVKLNFYSFFIHSLIIL